MFLPFGEYRPDLSDYEGQHSREITNAVPEGDGYGPFLSFKAFTSGLGTMARGLFYALKNDGSIQIFGASSTNLYTLNNNTLTWTNVSLGGGPYTACANTRNWDFIQYNQFVIAVQGNVAPQVYDLTSSSAFANLGGSPPQADFVDVVNQFVVLSGLASPNVYRLQWSGVGAPTSWTPGINQSDFNDFGDGGVVRGVAGGEYGIVFQDRAIRQMTYSPGSQYVFGFTRISFNDGIPNTPYSIVQSADRVFFYSAQGFKMIEAGAPPVPIGKERIDKYFATNFDSANPQLFIGVADPAKQRVYWCYKSTSGVATVFDSVLCYDWILDRWSLLSIMGEFIAPLAVPGLTLEQVDAAFGTGVPVAATSYSTTGLVTASTTGFYNGVITAGQGVIFTSSGSLPAWYTANTPYYVMSTNLTTAHFQVSASGGVGTLQGAVQSSTSTTSTSTGSGTLSYAHESIETLNLGSMDSISVGAEPVLGAIDGTHTAGIFNGPALQATLESAEHGDGMRRIYVNGFKPITDAPGVLGSLSARETQQTAAVYGTEQTVNAIGTVNQRKTTRYARAKIRIPAGTVWTFASGVEPDVKVEGQR